MTTYQEGVGIYHTNPLRCSDIGNVLVPAERQGPVRYCAPGTYGRMNSGLNAFAGDQSTPDGKLSRTEIEYRLSPTSEHPEGLLKGLTQLFTTVTTRDGVTTVHNVGTRTVEHWFGLTDRFGRVENRNCVPIAQRDHRICNMEGQGPRGSDALLRCLMACCLTVEGGLQRAPIYTLGDPQNSGLPYEFRWNESHLDDALVMLEGVYLGYRETLLGSVPTSQAWVQLNVEYGATGSGWDVVILYNYPQGQEYDDIEELPDDDDE